MPLDTLLLLVLLGSCACGALLRFPILGLTALLSLPLYKEFLDQRLPQLTQQYRLEVLLLLITGAGLVLLQGKRLQLRRKLPRPFVLAWISLTGFILLGVSYTRAPENGLKRALIHAVYINGVCCTCLTYLRARRDLHRLWWALIALGLGSTLGLILFGFEYTVGRRTFLEANPLGIANCCTQLALFGVLFAEAKRTPRAVCLGWLAFAAGAYGIFLTGTRGNLLALPLCLLVGLYLLRGQRPVRMVLLYGGAIFAVCSGLWLLSAPDHVNQRFSAAGFRSGTEIRQFMVERSLEHFLSSPLIGYGTGDSEAQLEVISASYPHNHLIEVAAELGLCGLVPYLILLAYGLHALQRLTQHPAAKRRHQLDEAYACSLLTLYLLLSLKTGSYTSSIDLSVALVLVVFLRHQRRDLRPEPTPPLAQRTRPDTSLALSSGS